MRRFLALLMLLALTSAAVASTIRKGATMRVKASSIWFQDAALLTRWQGLQQAGDAAALASWQDGLLKTRDAWQFLHPLDVKILGYRPKTHRVDVEMTSDGRMQGSRWMLDVDALVR
jgi:hypothetical protein